MLFSHKGGQENRHITFCGVKCAAHDTLICHEKDHGAPPRNSNLGALNNYTCNFVGEN